MQQKPPNPPFSQDKIQAKMNALRQARGGIAGNPEADWREAIRQLDAERVSQNGKKRNLWFWLNRPLVWMERRLWEPVLAWGENQALISLLGLLGNIGLLVAVLTYIGLEKQRREAQVYLAWQTITNAQGQPGNGGRVIALEFLNASPGANWRLHFPWICVSEEWLCFKWEAESLDGVDVANAYLAEIQLPRASLGKTNLQEAHLSGSNLQKAYLLRANLQEAVLIEANLQKANLRDANLQEAYLFRANLQKAYLFRANLQKAYLLRANLQEAVLIEANLRDVTGLTAEQLSEAKLCRTKLPKEINIDPNRDCKALDITP